MKRLKIDSPSGLAAAASIILLSGFWSIDRSLAQPKEPRPGPDFASFEESAEVEKWRATGQATVRQSADFASWQTNSLRVDVPADASGGVGTDYVPDLWHRREALQFFVYAGHSAELSVALQDGAATAARTVTLQRGSNHVQLRLGGFAGVNLEAVSNLHLGVSGGATGITLYLDRFRLTEHNDVLAGVGRMDAPYTANIETPHFRWANPYAKGPVRMLIVPDVAHGRSAAELAQRLESDLFAVTLGESAGRNRWGFGDFYGERGPSYGAPFTLAYTYLADDLLNGPDYDVMVLPGSRPWDEFPEVVRKAIRERVESGMGLVLLDMRTGDAAKSADLFELSPLRPVAGGQSAERWQTPVPHYITQNVPVDAFPYEQMEHTRSTNTGTELIRTGDGDPILAVKDVGKGRVVAAAWTQRGMIPLVRNQFQTSATWDYWEYMYSLLVRSIVWAAGKEPEAAVEAIQAAPDRIHISLAGTLEPDFAVDVRVRDEHWAVQEEHELDVSPSIEITPPATPRGRVQFVDVMLRNKTNGKILDWGTAVYTAVLSAEIAEIRFNADRFRAGEPVTGEFEIREAAGSGLVLRMGLYDNYGRLLDERSTPVQPEPARIPFSLQSEGGLTRLAWVQGQVLENGAERHKKRREVFILQPKKWDDYDVVMYLFGPDPAPGLWNTIQDRLMDLHVTTLSSYPLELSKHANFGVQAQTRISGQESPDGNAREPYLEQKRNFFRTRDKKHLARLHCLNDPAYLKRQEEEIAKLVPPWVPFSPMSYYIYEEPSLTCYTDAMDLCFSRYCLVKMRGWLNEEYGSLEAVNRQWGTSFKRWQDVIPDASEEAQARGNYSSWADHRTFMEKTYAENYAHVRGLLHQHDPDGLVLLSGTQESSPHNGCDYFRLNYIVGHLNPYTGGNQLDIHRSFNPELRMSGGTGYGASGRRALYNLYSGLFHGYWAGAYIFWQYSMLNPDYQFCQSAQDIRTVLEELRDGGIARIISTARRDNNRIALHYSYPSIHGTWIPDGRPTRAEEGIGLGAGPTGRKFIRNRDGWVNILKDLGLQFDFVARQQIEAGELISADFRLLVLPFSVAITEKEAAEIRKFVEAGGVLIADGQAGVMDGHARWLPRGSLEDLFGIARSSPVRAAQLASSAPEVAVEPKAGQALAAREGAPAVIVNERGRGKATYLNFFLDTYVEHRRDRREGEWKELVGQALAEAGIEAPFRVFAGEGPPLSDFQIVSYQAGTARYLGILKNDDLEVRSFPMKVELGEAWHVYDVREKRYLGRTATLRDSIRTAEPKLYALLPEEVKEIRMRAAGEARRGARFDYMIAVEGGRGVDSVVSVRVYRPDGSLAREYSENVEAKAGNAASGFHLALNDPAGTWSVAATEAASGRQATLTFTLP